jgi:phosphoribosylglycinamide formyltransferase-1
MLTLGFMASHGGSGMKAILEAIPKGLNANGAVFIGNNPKASAFAIAKQYNLTTYHLSSKTHQDPEQLDQAICSRLEQHNVELLILSGYMKKLGPLTLANFNNRIINIHPSLLPDYGGQGMYGDNVHKAVIKNRDPVSGASVHIVTSEYDQGPILIQKKVVLGEQETAETLGEKIKSIEGELYVDTLTEIISGRIQLPIPALKK